MPRRIHFSFLENRRPLRLWLATALILLAVAFGTDSALAQKKTNFRVGETVELNYGGYWVTAVVVERPPDGVFYKLKLNEASGGGVYFFNEELMRPLSRSSRPAPGGENDAPPPRMGSRPAPRPTPRENGGTYRVGDLVKIDDHQDGLKILPARIVEVRPEEPRYRIQFYSGAVLNRFGFVYSRQVVGRADGAIDEWEAENLVGPWSLVQGATANVTERYNSNGSITVFTERNLSTFGADLGISGDGTFVWKEDDGTVIRGRWVKSSDPQYSLILKRGRRGLDWRVWPQGKTTRGVPVIRLQSTALTTFYGFGGKVRR